MNTTVTQKNFDRQVIRNSNLSVVQFFAEWSGACQMMMPVFDELSRAYKSKAAFYSVNIDEEPVLKEQYGIMELPTILFFQDGDVIDFVAGVTSKNEFIEKLEKK
ncbi:MAG: thioredoxin domain-containing protein [Ferruginibacter sp.]